MRNAKNELIEVVGDKQVAYGDIQYAPSYDEIEIDLKFIGHESFTNQLKVLDFEYDCGYGGQMLFGTIVFTDGTWLERGEYDGSEWWSLKQLPSPKSVLGEDLVNEMLIEYKKHLLLKSGD